RVPAAAPERAVRQADPVPADTTGRQTDSVETRLRALWVRAIGRPDIDVHDDFFDLGGNSLSAVELMSDIRGAFDVDLSIAALFDYPTISSLATALAEQGVR